MVQDKYEAGADDSDKDDVRPVLGDFIRMQRQMANMSLRQLSALTEISNPYLSQVERGLHEPSIRVLKSIASALNVSSEILFEQAGLIKNAVRPDDDATEAAIRLDGRLTEAQRRALLGVYRSFVDANGDQSRAKSEGMTS
jgi:transcriptional regulator with XRE-family HTH domain